MSAVNQDVQALQFASYGFQKDREIVMSTVNQEGGGLNFVT